MEEDSWIGSFLLALASGHTRVCPLTGVFRKPIEHSGRSLKVEKAIRTFAFVLSKIEHEIAHYQPATTRVVGN